MFLDLKYCSASFDKLQLESHHVGLLDGCLTNRRTDDDEPEYSEYATEQVSVLPVHKH